MIGRLGNSRAITKKIGVWEEKVRRWKLKKRKRNWWS